MVSQGYGVKGLKEEQTVRKLRVPLQVHQFGNGRAEDVSVQQSNRLGLRRRQRQSGWGPMRHETLSSLNERLSSPDHWPRVREPNSLQMRRQKREIPNVSQWFDGRDASDRQQVGTTTPVFIPSSARTCSGGLSNTTFTRGHNDHLFHPCDGLLSGKTSGHVLLLPLLQRFAVHRPLQHKPLKSPLQVGQINA